MKALLRRCGDDWYTWKTAKYSAIDKRYIIDGERFCQTELLAVKEDDCSGHVICRNCGEKIKNDSESIERHFAEKEANIDCLQCKNACPYDKRMASFKYTPTENGKYQVTETYVSSLRCRMSYRDIDDPNTKANCIHSACRRLGVTEYGDILMKHPDLFETQITVDLINKNKYKLASSYDGVYYYDLKCRGTLFAVVNECGIVDHFYLKYQYRNTRFYYSSTQGKLFWNNNGNYDENKPNYLSSTKYNQVKDKIVALFKEATANE